MFSRSSRLIVRSVGQSRTLASKKLLEFPFARPFGAEPPLEFAKLRKEAPVAQVTIRETGATAWLLTKHADICNVLTDNVHFSKIRTREGFPELTKGGKLAAASGKPTFVDMDPPEHTVQRATVWPMMCPEFVQTLRPMIKQIVDQNIKKMMSAPSGSADLVADFGLPVASTIIYKILGVPISEMAFFNEQNATRTNGSATSAAAAAANKAFVDHLQKVIESQIPAAADGKDDTLIKMLINRQLNKGKMTLEEVVQVTFLMLVAGNATLVSMMALGVSTLLQHPSQLAELRANPALIPNAVQEICRFHTASALATRRIVIKDVTVRGVHLKVGDGVIAATQSGNRDEDAFPNPDRFDIHRDFEGMYKSLAYGHGPHQCVSEYLARLELEVVFEELFKAMPNLKLKVDFKDIKYSPAIADVGITELPITWK